MLHCDIVLSGSYGLGFLAYMIRAPSCIIFPYNMQELIGKTIDKTRNTSDWYLEVSDEDVISNLEADVWVIPSLVYEVQGADLSTSPVHTCALGEIKKDVGIAIRFPRFIRYREDKGAEIATTTSEIVDAYKRQRLLKKQDNT